MKLSPAARLTAGKFIIDAVQRKNLAEAWTLVGPELKVDTTYKQWLTGNISVIPFTGKLASAPLKIDVSQPRLALLEVALVPKSGKMSRGRLLLPRAEEVRDEVEGHVVGTARDQPDPGQPRRVVTGA